MGAASAYRLHEGLGEELARFGGSTLDRCFNCGNCTAVCGLTDGQHAFPRRVIRYLQLGLVERLVESTDPWLCYYCGQCSQTCPREAEPGELMMATRRWLTSRYDWTGLSRRLYLGTRWQIGMLLVVAVAVLLLFVLPTGFGFRLLARHPEAWSTVMLERFAPKDVVHVGDLVLAAVMGVFLLTNAARMAFRVWRGTGLPWPRLAAALLPLVVHGATQKRWRDCEGGEWKQWLRHFLLVTGYATLFALVVVFLPVFQVERGGLAGWHWTALFGYYGTVVLLATTLWIARDRWRKHDVIHRFSHQTDWLFLFLLVATVTSGILMHGFRMLDWAMATYVTYTAHLVIAVPMLAVEVPFGKWAHLLYRPLAAGLAAAADRAAAVVREPVPRPARA